MRIPIERLKTGKSLLIGTILILCISYAQPGYKEFRWGESISSVKNKVSELSKRSFPIFFSLQFAYMYEAWNLYEYSIQNPVRKLEGKLTILEEKLDQKTFIFLDSSLFAIQIHFFDENIMTMLTDKYGNQSPKQIFFRNQVLGSDSFLSPAEPVPLNGVSTSTSERRCCVIELPDHCTLAKSEGEPSYL